MSTKIFYNDNRIIIDGHANTPEECQAITAMCDSLANDENFKTIVYEKGHAVFENINGGDTMMFAMQKYVTLDQYGKEVGQNYDLAKGTIQYRLDELESELDEDTEGTLAYKIYKNNIALASTKGMAERNLRYIEILTARLDALEAEGFDARLAQLESRINALENKATKSLPYTADELITKLESI